MKETIPGKSQQVSSTQDSSQSTGSRYLQILHLPAQRPQRSFVAISAPEVASSTTSIQLTQNSTQSNNSMISSSPATIIATPNADEFVSLMTTKLGPLWGHRQTLVVNDGVAYETDDFRIRIGRLKQGKAINVPEKGVIVEIEWLVPGKVDALNGPLDRKGDDKPVDWDGGEKAIRQFWESLGMAGAREFIRIAGIGGKDGAVLDLSRQYCEMLRLRA
jgi:TATA-binding related factor (TRF) of subunit 20 of Mediator complex